MSTSRNKRTPTAGGLTALISRYTAPIRLDLGRHPADGRMVERTEHALRTVGFSRPSAAVLALDPEATATVFAGIGAVGGTLLGAALVALLSLRRCSPASPGSVNHPPDHK